MSREDWFQELRKPKWPDYVKTRDDTIHPIQHTNNVPFGEEGNQTYIKNFLHVTTITKNLVSIGQIVEQGKQVHFNDKGCFIEKEGRLIARGRREGRIFILDSHVEMISTMYAKGHEANADIELWHKRVGHINLQKLKGMPSKGVVIGLPTFTEKEITGVCEACQFGKQHRQPFPKERNMNKGIPDVIHLDVWGPA